MPLQRRLALRADATPVEAPEVCPSSGDSLCVRTQHWWRPRRYAPPAETRVGYGWMFGNPGAVSTRSECPLEGHTSGAKLQGFEVLPEGHTSGAQAHTCISARLVAHDVHIEPDTNVIPPAWCFSDIPLS